MLLLSWIYLAVKLSYTSTMEMGYKIVSYRARAIGLGNRYNPYTYISNDLYSVNILYALFRKNTGFGTLYKNMYIRDTHKYNLLV